MDEIPEESQMGQSSNRMEYPSTPKQFNLFQEYKNEKHGSKHAHIRPEDKSV